MWQDNHNGILKCAPQYASQRRIWNRNTWILVPVPLLTSVATLNKSINSLSDIIYKMEIMLSTLPSTYEKRMQLWKWSYGANGKHCINCYRKQGSKICSGLRSWIFPLHMFFDWPTQCFIMFNLLPSFETKRFHIKVDSLLCLEKFKNWTTLGPHCRLATVSLYWAVTHSFNQCLSMKDYVGGTILGAGWTWVKKQRRLLLSQSLLSGGVGRGGMRGS